MTIRHLRLLFVALLIATGAAGVNAKPAYAEPEDPEAPVVEAVDDTRQCLAQGEPVATSTCALQMKWRPSCSVGVKVGVTGGPDIYYGGAVGGTACARPIAGMSIKVTVSSTGTTGGSGVNACALCYATGTVTPFPAFAARNPVATCFVGKAAAKWAFGTGDPVATDVTCV